jgi:hypothetical protein
VVVEHKIKKTGIYKKYDACTKDGLVAILVSSGASTVVEYLTFTQRSIIFDNGRSDESFLPLQTLHYYLAHEERRRGVLFNNAHTCIRVYSRAKSHRPKKKIEEGETVGIIIRRRETNPSLESQETEGDGATRRSSYLQFEQSSLCQRPIVIYKTPGPVTPQIHEQAIPFI